MKIHFYKYQGTGNDFIIIDGMNEPIKLTKDQIAFLCHRRFGIGADGLMILAPSTDFDFKMIYFNSDGAESTMCGNGGRCLVQFARHKCYISEDTVFEAIDGTHNAKVLDNNWVALKMINVNDMFITKDNYVLNTGSPHYVTFVSNIENHNVREHGAKIRYSQEFEAEGINVNFVERQGNNHLFVRTYERGVEDETYSCGTGVCAAAIASVGGSIGNFEIEIKTLGGDMSVSFEKIQAHSALNISLNGPAVKVFEGEIDF